MFTTVMEIQYVFLSIWEVGHNRKIMELCLFFFLSEYSNVVLQFRYF